MSTVTISNSPIHSDSVLTAVYGETGPNWSKFHTGTDFAPTGQTPSNPALYSVCTGTVVRKKTDSTLGNQIQIRDNSTGHYWRYCHMQSPTTLNVGDTVTTQTQVGIMGATGNVTGIHLHLELSTTMDWDYSTFLNPSTALSIPNTRGTIVKYDGQAPFPETEWIYKDDYLNENEKENNAICVINIMRSLGINDTTIAGILGNMEAESTIEPHLNERGGGGGYGLVQWTPQTVLINHCNTLNISPYTDGDVQCRCIYYEILGNPASINEWYTSSGFISNYYNSGATQDMIGISGQDFINNTMNWSADKLAILFMAGYERPSYDPNINHYQKRKEYALKWFEFMGGYIPIIPIVQPKKSKFNWVLYSNKLRKKY